MVNILLIQSQKTWHYLSHAVHVTTLRDGLFQHFYQHLGCYNHQVHTTQLTEQCIIVDKVIIYLQNTNYAGCFVQKCVFIVAMVTGLLLGLQVSGGLCPDRNGKTVTSRKKFTIWHICTIKCTVGP